MKNSVTGLLLVLTLYAPGPKAADGAEQHAEAPPAIRMREVPESFDTNVRFVLEITRPEKSRQSFSIMSGGAEIDMNSEAAGIVDTDDNHIPAYVKFTAKVKYLDDSRLAVTYTYAVEKPTLASCPATKEGCPSVNHYLYKTFGVRSAIVMKHGDKIELITTPSETVTLELQSNR